MNVVYLNKKFEKLKHKQPAKKYNAGTILYGLAYVGAGALAITLSPLIATWALYARIGCQHTWLPSSGDKVKCLHCNKRKVNTSLLGTEKL